MYVCTSTCCYYISIRSLFCLFKKYELICVPRLIIIISCATVCHFAHTFLMSFQRRCCQTSSTKTFITILSVSKIYVQVSLRYYFALMFVGAVTAAIAHVYYYCCVFMLFFHFCCSVKTSTRIQMQPADNDCIARRWIMRKLSPTHKWRPCKYSTYVYMLHFRIQIIFFCLYMWSCDARPFQISRREEYTTQHFF